MSFPSKISANFCGVHFSGIPLTLALASTELPNEESGCLVCVTHFLHDVHTNMSLDHDHSLKGSQQTHKKHS